VKLIFSPRILAGSVRVEFLGPVRIGLSYLRIGIQAEFERAPAAPVKVKLSVYNFECLGIHFGELAGCKG
jgi:hypothetical protein